MSVGTRILQSRIQKNLSQTQLSQRTGMAGSYLSRIENRKIEPGPRTLKRIAAALGVPLSELFREGAAAPSLHQCVVTMSGICIMESMRNRKNKRRPPHAGAENYTSRQLQLLRMANYLIQNGSPRVLDSLDLLFSSLLSSSRGRKEARGLVSLTPPPPAQH